MCYIIHNSVYPPYYTSILHNVTLTGARQLTIQLNMYTEACINNHNESQ